MKIINGILKIDLFSELAFNFFELISAITKFNSITVESNKHVETLKISNLTNFSYFAYTDFNIIGGMIIKRGVDNSIIFDRSNVDINDIDIDDKKFSATIKMIIEQFIKKELSAKNSKAIYKFTYFNKTLTISAIEILTICDIIENKAISPYKKYLIDKLVGRPLNPFAIEQLKVYDEEIESLKSNCKEEQNKLKIECEKNLAALDQEQDNLIAKEVKIRDDEISKLKYQYCAKIKNYY